ncbi:tetratricopeptide repeat protein, partial [Microvirga soli]|uniref:tetratricopeptide repeat protein n=1 Tax=Microvirga soli TaxID=1854496 RepID=UPI00192005A9
ASALTYFEAAAELEPHNLPVKLEVATELRDRGQYDEAKAIIDAALRIEPGNVHGRMQRGYLQRHVGDRVSARSEFQKVRETNPDFLQASVELAVEERALGKPGLAEQILKKVLEIQPDHLSALTQLAESARVAGDMERCLDVYQRAEELHPSNLGLHIQISQILSECGERAAAFELLDTANLRFPKRWEIGRKRAELLKQAGYLPDARELAETILSENPQNFALWSQCVQFDLLFGDLAAAAVKLQSISSDITFERARIHVFRGQLAEAQYNFEEAREHYQMALMLNPQDGWAHAEMFRACMLLLRIDEARNHLEAWTLLNAPGLVARGQSTNVTQSHMGQAYDEFALNRVLITKLADIRMLPADERIAPLQDLLRSNGDHSAPAIQLILAIRLAQLSSVPPPKDNREGLSHIPRQIIQYWNDPHPPEDVTHLMDTWRSFNTDYSHQVFDDVSAREFLTKNYAPHVLSAYRRAGSAAEKADLFRLAYLYAHGGVYVDADDRCLAPISSVLPSHVGLAVYQEDYALGGLAVGTLGNNFLAAAPNNAVIGRALESAAEALNRGDTDVVWLKTGPALITRAFAEIAAKTPLRLAAWLENVAILERNQLSRFIAMHCFTAYKKTPRHWSNTVGATQTLATRR